MDWLTSWINSEGIVPLIISVEFENSDIQREEVIKEVLDIYGGVVPESYIESES